MVLVCVYSHDRHSDPASASVPRCTINFLRFHPFYMLYLQVFRALHDTSLTSSDVEYDLDTKNDNEKIDIVIDSTRYIFLDIMGRKVTDSMSLNDVIQESIDRYDSETIHLWLVPQKNLEIKAHCSGSIFDAFEHHLVQPCYQLRGTDYKVCSRCSAFLGDGMFERNHKLMLECFQCDIFKLIDAQDFLPFVVAEHLINEKMDYAVDDDSEGGGDLPFPLLMHLKRLAFNNALEQLRESYSRRECNPERIMLLQDKITKFRLRIEKTAEQVMVYEDAEQQQIARLYVDYERVIEYAQEFCDKSINSTRRYSAKELQVIHEKSLFLGLMRWFKADFFEWCNKPGCSNHSCSKHLQSSQMIRLPEMGTPSHEEESLGWASRVELYRCGTCEEVRSTICFLLHTSSSSSYTLSSYTSSFCVMSNACVILLRQLDSHDTTTPRTCCIPVTVEGDVESLRTRSV